MAAKKFGAFFQIFFFPYYSFIVIFYLFHFYSLGNGREREGGRGEEEEEEKEEIDGERRGKTNEENN